MTTAMATPATMRALVLHGPGDLRQEQRTTPAPGNGEVLVRVASVGVCGSDIHFYRDGRCGQSVVEAPVVIGHEFSGRIVACGAGVDPGRVGQRVAVEPGVGCRWCGQCLAGRYNLCPHIRFLGDPPIDGALQEYVVVEATHAFPLPDTVSDDAGALIEPLSVALWAAEKARIVPGNRVLITGAGPVGLLATQAARLRGAREITVVDLDPYRLAVARTIGASTAGLPDQVELTDLDGCFDAVIECTGASRVQQDSVQAVAPAGRAVLVGIGATAVTLPLGVLQNREVTVTGTFRYARTWPSAIALAASGDLELDRLVTARYRLDDARVALESAGRSPGSVKSVIRPGDPPVSAVGGRNDQEPWSASRP